MAAVRCLARRLGGSLLQRTQAEEGRRLVPNSLMRSRLLSNEASGTNASETEVDKQMRRLIDALKEKKAHLEANKLTPFQLSVRYYGRLLDGAISGVGKFAFLCFVPYSVYFGLSEIGKRVKAHAVNKENQ